MPTPVTGRSELRALVEQLQVYERAYRAMVTEAKKPFTFEEFAVWLVEQHPLAAASTIHQIFTRFMSS